MLSMKKSKSTKKSSKAKKPRLQSSVDKYKEGLLEVNKVEDRYDAIFEEKLASQYNEFRELKEHSEQIKKLLRVLSIIMIIVVIVLLVLTYMG